MITKTPNPLRMQSHLNRGYDQLAEQIELFESSTNPTSEQLKWFKLGFDMAWSKAIISLEKANNVAIDDCYESD